MNRHLNRRVRYTCRRLVVRFLHTVHRGLLGGDAAAGMASWGYWSIRLGSLGEGYVELECDAWYTGWRCLGLGSDPRVANLRLGMRGAVGSTRAAGVEEFVMASDSCLLGSAPEMCPRY